MRLAIHTRKNLSKTITKKFAPGILLAVCLAQAGHISASVSLDHSWKLEKAEEISSMVEMAEQIIVSDHAQNKLYALDEQGVSETPLSSSPRVFGSEGIAAMSKVDNDTLAVVSQRQSRFAMLTPQGELVVRMGSEGSGAGEIDAPRGLAYSVNRRLYIADSGNGRVAVFGSDGIFLKNLGREGLAEKQQLQKPLQVLIDTQERVFVLDGAERGRVLIFDHNGQLLETLSHSRLESMLGENAEYTAMALDERGFLYLADSSNGRIYQLDWQQQKKLSAFGSRGEERGQFRQVAALLPLKDGRLAVADSRNKKVEVYKLDIHEGQTHEQVRLPTVTRYLPVKMQCRRAYRMPDKGVLCINSENNQLEVFSDKGKKIKQYDGVKQARALALSQDRMAVLDGDRIKLFNYDGQRIGEGNGFGGAGSAEGKLSSPGALYLRHSKVYVADTGNRRVQIFSEDGIYLDKIENPKQEDARTIFEEPSSVVADAQGNIFVADKGNNQLHVFSAGRQYLYSLGNETQGSGFQRIYDIAMDTDNNLYVLCGERNNRYTVHVYNGPRKVIAFSSESESDVGMEEPVNLSVSMSNRRLIGVYDAEKNKLLNFSYQQVPQQVGNVVVSGGIKRSVIKWSAVPGRFVKGYNVYGAKNHQGDYSFVDQVYTNSLTVAHKKNSGNTFYKVNAFTGLGSVGKYSRPVEDVFARGLQLYKAGQYAEAASVYGQSLEENRQQPEAYKYYGLAKLALSETDLALNAFREMMKFDGYVDEALNLQIRALVESKDYIAARAIVDKLIAAGTADDDAYIFCGELNLKMNDAIGAVTCLEEAVSRRPESIDAHYLLGDAYVKLGVIEKGLAEFDKATEISPDNANVWYRGARVLEELGQLDEAITRYRKAQELDNSHTQIQLALAKALLSKQAFAEVKNIAISLAGKTESAGEGRYILGLVALAEKSNGEALLAFAKATRISPQHVDAWLSLADVYAALGQQDKVLPTLESAYQADEYSLDAAMRLGEKQIAGGEYAAAIPVLERALAIDGKNYDACLKLADAQYRESQLGKAFSSAALAARLNDKAVEPLVLLSKITDQQGKVGNAIDYMKRAMKLKKNSFELTYQLGKLYSDNNLFDMGVKHLQKASLLNKTSDIPHVYLGDLYLKRRLFDKAIRAYDKAVAVNPLDENRLRLDTAYAEKKRSLEFKSNAPQIVLKDLKLDHVFSAAYKQYTSKPVGRVRIQNTSGVDYGNLKLSFSIKGYMDFPSSQEIVKLAANETQEIDLHAAFNNRILEIDEDTGVQVEVALKFTRDGREDAIKLTQPMTIFGKNAILWREPRMVGSFVTPKDDTLRDFVRTSINENKPRVGPLSDNLVTAMTLFDVFTAHGIRYVVDPNNPYSKVNNDSVDYVQFSRETLKIKSGDCDDLSVLMSAGLENLGIKTAILDVPGHLLVMFDSGIAIEEKDRISLQDNLMVEFQGNVWIPVEVTMIGTSFSEAWAEGARKYYSNQQAGSLNVIAMNKAWEAFLPVTLKPATYMVKTPASDRVKPLVTREQAILMQKSLDRLVKPYEAMASLKEENQDVLMQIAIIYAKHGLYSEANTAFERILEAYPDDSAVHNNRGNIHYAQGRYDRAIETYAYAEQLAANDPGVKVNLAMSYYQLGKLNDARMKFDEAKMINQTVMTKYSGLAQLLAQ